MTARRIAWFAIGALGLVALAPGPVGGQPSIVAELGRANPHTPARRLAFLQPALNGPIDHVAVIGDSLYFDHNAIDFGPVNTIIPVIRDTLRSGLHQADFRVQNLSRPGLATAFPNDARDLGFITLAEWIRDELPVGPGQPDLVVIPATNIDLNLNQHVTMDELVPGLVAELQRVVRDLERRGVQVVIVPAFGINDVMYDTLKSFLLATPVVCNANARINALNAGLNNSDLPLLFPRFLDLDTDFDGDVDESLFVDHNPGRVTDDGLHPNQSGQNLIAKRIGTRLLELIRATR